MTRHLRTPIASLFLLALAPLLAPAPAQAATALCPSGSAAGQCAAGFEGIATDFEVQKLYVADKGNNRVDVFALEGGEVKFKFAFGWKVNAANPEEKLQTCTLATGCQVGSAGAGAGQLSSPTWIAVDNSAGPSHHYLYVSDANHRIQKFDPTGAFLWAAGSAGSGPGQMETIRGIGVSGTGQVYVVDTKNEGNCEGEASKGSVFLKRIHKYSEGGGEEGEVLPTDVPCGQISGFAVTAAGEYWVASIGTGQGLRKYAAAGTTTNCSEDLGLETRGLGLDAEGHLFAAQRDSGAGLPTGLIRVVTEFDATACPARLSRFGYGKFAGDTPNGIAPLHSSLGDVFAAQTVGEIAYLATPAPGPLAIYVEPAAAVGNTKASVKAVINPEGNETQYRFQWVGDADYEADKSGGGDGFEGEGVSETSPPAVLGIPEGISSANATATTTIGCPVASEEAIKEGKCLAPGTEYHWRVIATNADNPTGAGQAHLEGTPFTTAPPLEGEAFASAVGISSAKLSAIVNPLGIPTTGVFEYVTEAQFQKSDFAEAAKVPDFGAGEAELDFGTGEGRVRKSRVVFGLQEGTTYRFRLAAGNPFFGATPTAAGAFTTYRTPVDETDCSNQAFRTGPSAALADCRAYEMVSPLDKEGADVAVLSISSGPPAVLAQSAVEGNRMTYGSYRSFGGASAGSYTSQYLASRMPGGWASEPISPPKGANVKPQAVTNNEYFSFSEDLCRGILTTFSEPRLDPGASPGAIAGYFNIYRRHGLCEGPASYAAVTTAKAKDQPASAYSLELQGSSADGRVVAFAANDDLEGTTAPTNSGSQTQLYAQEEGGMPVYACILPGGGGATAAACSAGSGEGLVSFGNTRFASVHNALAEDGKSLYWSDSSFSEGHIYLRENPLAGGPECSGAGSACTVAVSAGGEAQSGVAGKSHFWAAAADGSKALYSTNGTGGDLYLFGREGPTTTKIAGQSAGVAGTSETLSRIYFASKEAISGSGQNSEGDEAVAGRPNLYLYEAGGGGSYRFIGTLAEGNEGLTNPQPLRHSAQAAADGKVLIFASKARLTAYDNTDGASTAPCGKAGGICDSEAYLYDAEAEAGAGQLLCLSCNPTGGRPEGSAELPVYETTLYQPRALFERGGRVIFQSSDPLSPRDSNGKIDVYQWERPGIGGCEVTDTSYSAQNHGCVQPISSGQAKQDASFVDADESGRNVFFTTSAGLVPQDYGLIDVYDARVEGGFPESESAHPPCEGEACQGAYVAPEDPTPGSSTFHGAGNVVEPLRRSRACKKPKAKKKGRCVKPKLHKKHKHRARRGRSHR